MLNVQFLPRVQYDMSNKDDGTLPKFAKRLKNI